jgi:hypothetical protein
VMRVGGSLMMLSRSVWSAGAESFFMWSEMIWLIGLEEMKVGRVWS